MEGPLKAVLSWNLCSHGRRPRMNASKLETLARAAKRTMPEDAAAQDALVNALSRAETILANTLELSFERLGRAIAMHLGESEGLEVAASWRLDELYLATCAVDGDTESVKRIESLLGKIAVATLARRGFTQSEIDEVAQALLVKLLVSSERGTAKLALYSGRGDLGGFLRSAVMRAGLNARRHETRHSFYAVAQRLEQVLDEPELHHLKQAYLSQFREALRTAWDQLEPDKKLALRLQLEDGLTIDELAGLWNVHRATAARRLVAARQALAQGTRQGMQHELQLSDSEVESVMNLIRSRLDDATDALE